MSILSRREVLATALAGTVVAGSGSNANAKETLEADAGKSPEVLLCYNGELHYRHKVRQVPVPAGKERDNDPMRYQANVESVMRISQGRYQVNFQYEMEQDDAAGRFRGYVGLANANSGYATVTGWRYPRHCTIQTATLTGELTDCEFYLAIFGSRKKDKLPAGSWPVPFEEMNLTPPPNIDYASKHLHPRLGTLLEFPSSDRIDYHVNAIGRIDFEGFKLDVWELYYNSRHRWVRCMIARPLSLNPSCETGLITAIYGSNGMFGQLLDPRWKDEQYFCWPIRLARIANMPILVIDSTWGVHTRFPLNSNGLRWNGQQLLDDINAVRVAEQFLPKLDLKIKNDYFVSGHSEGAARTVFLSALMHGKNPAHGFVKHAFAIETEMEDDLLRSDMIAFEGQYPTEWSMTGWGYSKMLASCPGQQIHVAFSTSNYHQGATEATFAKAQKGNPQLTWRYHAKTNSGGPMDHGTLVEAAIWENQDRAKEGDMIKLFRKYCSDIGVQTS